MRERMCARVGLLGLAALLAGLLAACGGSAPSESDLQATVAAGIRATTSAQQAQADIQATIAAGVRATTEAQAAANLPTATATAAPTVTEQPTSPPVAAPTQGVFRPAATADSSAAPTTAAGAAPNEAAPAATPVVFGPQSGASKQQTVNIELIFDASGSMAQRIGDETKIQAARRAMEQVIAQLPDNAPNFNVGFRVYGHKGDSSEAKKAESCQSTELLVPVQGINKELLRQQTNAFQPTGWTPISLALQKAGEDLKAGDNVKNVIIMVTDGEETCGGDPCAVAKALNESGAEVRIDVVGFGTAPEEDRNLRCIADNSGGTYSSAQSGAALIQSLQQLVAATVKRSYLRIIAVGPDGKQLGYNKGHPWRNVIYIASVVDAQGRRPEAVATGMVAGEGSATPLENEGEESFELPPGTYRFTIKQQLGWNKSRGDLPLVNAEQTYTAEVVEGQQTDAVVGIGALVMKADGGEPEYACDLQLEVALDGRWQVAYPAVDGFCSRDPDGIIVQGGDLSFNREYPLLPGRYRLRDVRRGKLLTDSIVIEPGKTVTVQIQGLTRYKQP